MESAESDSLVMSKQELELVYAYSNGRRTPAAREAWRRYQRELSRGARPVSAQEAEERPVGDPRAELLCTVVVRSVVHCVCDREVALAIALASQRTSGASRDISGQIGM